jgi:hypothetical protein
MKFVMLPEKTCPKAFDKTCPSDLTIASLSYIYWIQAHDPAKVSMQANETDIASWRLLPTEDGIRLSDSILWLDARSTAELSFLSSASGLSGRSSSQVITTEETSRLLGMHRIPLNALICPYNQTISIGPLNLELLPSGAGLGAASLYIKTPAGDILYAPKLQPQKTGISRTMQLKNAETLVLGAHTPFPPHHHPSRRKEKDRLLHTVQDYLKNGQFPVILCDPYAIAQEICKFLAEAGIELSVARSIYSIHKIYEEYGSDLGPYALHHRKMREPRVFVIPSTLAKKSALPLPAGPIFCIDESPHQQIQVDLLRPAAERFLISQTCDARELKTIIQTVDPNEVFITGPYAKQYASELASLKTQVKIEALFPSHLPTLF